ncbi:Rieske 2Fe-2S domain-containing protein [[Leptolyngbya] sp. PCC 7376]|uniref:Rieske 2Fe-2S domain-containing protein n=1 Tax=[Leptolyngbya] sp. PCC 7376 TaxID=111781 RepID=UPI00030FED47|nr:Rieske 2Fe-2S domain-containing protein [[Leptolyngbya] sp. PCC 7376]
MQAILPGAPWLVAHRSMLGINCPYKLTLNGQDYVLWQNAAGEIFGLNNICPHMQAPLSNGWICEERNTITCPFHALEFDGVGRLWRDGEFGKAPISETLELIIDGDLIWTYGGFEPKLPVPKLHRQVASEYEFLGVTAEKSIQSEFLRSLMINYDHNHQNGTHREFFKCKSCQSKFVEKNDIYAKVAQTVEKDHYTPEEIATNPMLGAIPEVMHNFLEYVFPSTQFFCLQSPEVQTYQGHVLYPETENQTKTFILLYAKFSQPELKAVMQDSLLNAASIVVQQDTECLESLYPMAKSKVHLDNEDIMFYAEELYEGWGQRCPAV